MPKRKIFTHCQRKKENRTILNGSVHETRSGMIMKREVRFNFYLPLEFGDDEIGDHGRKEESNPCKENSHAKLDRHREEGSQWSSPSKLDSL